MNKRKIVLLAVALCMVAILGFGGTLAYLTDYDHQVNTFVTGQVGLNLDEAVVEKVTDSTADNYGDFVATGERTDESQTYDKVFPGNKIDKDPTITVDDGSEDAWVIVEINIWGKEPTTENGKEPTTENGKDIYDLFGVGEGRIDITKDGIFSGGLISENVTADEYHGLENGYGNDKFFLYQQEYAEDLHWRLWLFMKKPMAANASEKLFTTIEVPADWKNEDIIAFNGLEIDVKAYGIQADGFADAYDAMATAFPDAAQF